MKNLQKMLGLSQGFLKGLAGGSGVKDSEFVRINTANCCKSVAQYTGYNSEENARIAIRAQMKKLFYPAEKYAKQIERILPKYRVWKQQALVKAIAYLRAGNGTGFNLELSKIDSLKRFQRVFKSKPDSSILDELRARPRASRNEAKAILQKHTGKRELILVPEAAINAEIDKRAKRWGITGSLFWQAAKDINPKIRPGKLPKGKKRTSFKTRGSRRIIKKENELSAVVEHIAEAKNKRFRKNLEDTIKRQLAFWENMTERQILASKYLGKSLEG